jgi:5-methylcytosine-specific restriction endonuclease McrA
MVRRATTKKLRYEVLRRDGFRCKVCGRSPDEDVHVTIEAHHISPFGYGGVTTADNLITLCKTCHDGVHESVGGKSRPGVALELYPLIGVHPVRDLIDNQPDYEMGVELYRRISRAALRER